MVNILTSSRLIRLTPDSLVRQVANERSEVRNVSRTIPEAQRSGTRLTLYGLLAGCMNAEKDLTNRNLARFMEAENNREQ